MIETSKSFLIVSINEVSINVVILLKIITETRRNAFRMMFLSSERRAITIV